MPSSGRPSTAARRPARSSVRFPTLLEPQLATLVEQPPGGDDWLHEIKYDGYRLLARVADGQARLLTRNGKDWTDRFPSIAEALGSVPTDRVWLDGEIVAFLDSGASSFAALQERLSSGGDQGLVYVLFDAPWIDGEDWTGKPLQARRQALGELLEKTEQGVLRFSESLHGQGDAFFRQACEHGLEGVISKRISARYRAGRSRDWVKSKCQQRQEFVIGGYTESDASGRPFGALLLGLYEDGQLRYSGRVGTGFNARSSPAILARLRELETDRCPYQVCPPAARNERLHWVRPALVAEVRFSNWTTDGVLRHPSFQGLREDKPARAVVPELSASSRAAAIGAEPGSRSGAPSAGQVKFTNPDRVLYPAQGLTKLDLARYYETVAEAMMPYLRQRPLSLLRCPQGYDQDCFYQKHLSPPLPAGIEGFRADDGDAHPVVTSVDGLLSLVQLGVLEVHGWGARSDRPERPDQITFDLDPGPKVAWPDTVQAARLLRVLLEGLGLAVFLKTTGGKGLHLVVPITRRHDWDEVKSFSKAVARQLVRFDPQRFSSSLGKAGRQNKVFVDYLRNSRGATAVLPYSTRAREGAPVAVPLTWDELDESLRPDGFKVYDARRIAERSAMDPWRDFHASAQQITAQMWAALESE